MDEIKFVLKTFLITCVVVYGLQFKLGVKSGDKHLNDFLQSHRITHWLRDMGNGAIQLLAATYGSIKEQKIPNFFSEDKKTRTPAQGDEVPAQAAQIKKSMEDLEMESAKKFAESPNYDDEAP